MRFSDAWLDELRSRADIVDIVSGYVPLKQKGRRFWGCCPFHTEKTPSFSVDSAAQLYYCFGCHKGGNVIHFVMEMDRLEFTDAVKDIAERVHMPLPETGSQPQSGGVSREERDQIRAANREAALFYHENIWKEEGAKALTYLHRRGLSDRDIRRFGLGSTAAGKDACCRHLRAKGYSDETLSRAGLSVRRESGMYDMFRDRVIFPIIDAHGSVLGFGGRVLDQGEPKYLNTGDTPVFNKRRNLYAANFFRKERNLSRLILAEGYMDVISLRCAGVEGVVATLGTALTEEQTRLMKRIAPEVWVSYDGDSAGQKAALRALDLFDQIEITARVIDYPEGKDPDDYIREHGKAGFDALKPLTATEYRMARLADGVDMSQEEERANYAIRCCAVLRKVRNPVERDRYMRKLEMQTGFTRSILDEQMGVVPTPETQARQPVRRSTYKPPEGILKYEKELLSLLAKGVIPTKTLQEEDFSEGLHRDIARLLLGGVSPSAIPDRLSLEGGQLDEAVGALHMEMLPEDPEKALSYAADCLQRIRVYTLENRHAELMEEFRSTPEERRGPIREALIAIENERARLSQDQKE